MRLNLDGKIKERHEVEFDERAVDPNAASDPVRVSEVARVEDILLVH